MTNQVSSRWANWSLWFWVARACVVGLVIADVSVAHPGPGLGGHHLVLLVGGIFAAAASLAYPLLERVGERVSALVLAAGVVGGCLAALVSPSSGALVLPALIAATAGASLSFPIAAGAAGCGLVTLGTSSIVVTSPGFSLLGSSLAVLGGLLAGLWRRQYVLRAEQAELMSVEAERAKEEHGRAKALDERARLAREIHDVLAHTLGGLVVQLDAADAVLGETGDSAKARRLVVSARRLAVEGLEETRRAIAALRLDPVALPDMLAALADSVGRDRWVHVTTKLTGIPRELLIRASPCTAPPKRRSPTPASTLQTPRSPFHSPTEPQWFSSGSPTTAHRVASTPMLLSLLVEATDCRGSRNGQSCSEVRCGPDRAKGAGSSNYECQDDRGEPGCARRRR